MRSWQKEVWKIIYLKVSQSIFIIVRAWVLSWFLSHKVANQLTINIFQWFCAERVQIIPWPTRISIAVDVARGLSFLHGLEANVIYRDLKASNILLDSVNSPNLMKWLAWGNCFSKNLKLQVAFELLQDFNAKLSDFGLARDGPSGDRTHVSTRVVGTTGYAAPEYVASGFFLNLNSFVSFFMFFFHPKSPFEFDD